MLFIREMNTNQITITTEKAEAVKLLKNYINTTFENNLEITDLEGNKLEIREVIQG